MGDLIPFPDRSAILIDRTEEGFTVEPYRCPLAAGMARTFTHAGDALDYAEALATQAGSGVCALCDL